MNSVGSKLRFLRASCLSCREREMKIVDVQVVTIPMESVIAQRTSCFLFLIRASRGFPFQGVWQTLQQRLQKQIIVLFFSLPPHLNLRKAQSAADRLNLSLHYHFYWICPQWLHSTALARCQPFSFFFFFFLCEDQSLPSFQYKSNVSLSPPASRAAVCLTKSGGGFSQHWSINARWNPPPRVNLTWLMVCGHEADISVSQTDGCATNTVESLLVQWVMQLGEYRCL